jgi:hypothetical protein
VDINNLKFAATNGPFLIFIMSFSLEQMLEQYPFLSYIKYPTADFIGIIQNFDGDIVSMYAFNKLKTEEDKRGFLEAAEIWWWESNRLIPINIFLKHGWDKYRYSTVTLTTKDIREQCGHIVSIARLAERRTKRRVVQLVKRLG